ncbi:MAG: type III pantothenate kinase [Gallionella sp.]|jgi:type III pantothenate kinase
MRLLIDSGNSNIKLALVDGERWWPVVNVPNSQSHDLCFADYPEVRQVWVSNVAGPDVARRIKSACAARHWVPQFITAQIEKCGVRNGYDQAAQLGSDRWASLLAAWHHVGAECLVVGSGTATTIDALSGNGEFMGGLILPGIELMQCSLISATAQLQSGGGCYASFPRNTADALLSGALQASCGAIQRQYALLDSVDAPVLLSGGAACLLSPYLSLPVQMMDNLVLQGLLLISQEADKV